MGLVALTEQEERPEHSLSPPSKTQRDGSHLPAGREPFSGNQLGQDFDLGLSNPSTLRNKFLLLKLSLQYFFLWESENTEPVSECVVQEEPKPHKTCHRLSSSVPQRPRLKTPDSIGDHHLLMLSKIRSPL